MAEPNNAALVFAVNGTGTGTLIVFDEAGELAGWVEDRIDSDGRVVEVLCFAAEHRAHRRD